MRSRLLLTALLVLVSVGALLAYLENRHSGPTIAPGDVPPTSGRWTPARSTAGEAAPGDDALARVLSLPYVAGKVEAGNGPYGVTAWQRDRAWPGVNLVVSAHGPEVFLMDMQGDTLHRWRCAFEQALPDKPPTDETSYIRRARLLPHGDLLVIYQGGGMARLDADSHIRWTYDAGFYNDLRIGPDGNIFSLTKRARTITDINPEAPVLEDSLLVLSPEGKLLHRLSLLQAMRSSHFARLLDGMDRTGDILHGNTVEPFDGSLLTKSPLFARGNVLFSLRQVSVIGIINPANARILWAVKGEWRHQHQPTLLPSGHILLFDNLGAGGEHSRVLEIEVPSGRVVSTYDGPSDDPLWSEQGGVVQRLPNGDTMVVESERGRALEVAPNGDVVWEFLSPFRAGAHHELVATLFQMQRLPGSAASWLKSGADG